ELIVNLRNSDVLSDVTTMLRSRGRGAAADRLEELFSARLDSVVQSLPAGVTVEERYEFLGGLLISVRTSEALDALGSLPNVLSIGVPEVSEPLLTESLALINQPEAAAAGYEGAGTAVAVLDTGVDYLNSAFGSCNGGGANCRVKFVGDFTPGYADNSRDDHGHGTNVSGIVAGVAPGTGILGLDVFRKDLGGLCAGQNCASDADIMSAINWVLANVGVYDTKSVNMSLGSGPHSAGSCPTNLQPSFQSLMAAGILPVVASGNNASTSLIAYPGCIPEAYTVGAVYDANGSGVSFGICTDSSRAVDRVTCFSNSNGTMLDSVAPGGAITAAGITMYGTSQATPHVAGAAAVLGAIEGVTVAEVENALKTTGPLITDHRNGVQKRRLDLEAAVGSVAQVEPPGQPIAMTAAQTQDDDADGRIDGIRLVFAENVNDDFDDLSVAVAGYQVTGFRTDSPGDASIIVELSEKSGPDSGAEPLVTIVANDSLGTAAALVGPDGASMTAADEAGPAIAAAETKTSRIVLVHFSEPMNKRSVRVADFRLAIGGTVRAITRVVMVDSDTWEIRVARSSKWSSGSSGTVQLTATSVVKDSSRNKSQQTATVPVAAVY
ncbi:MAG TPA: S8 family serine peptidase, partial [Dehalococcoidia bacterium]|nr:S8 family serine peptidase [Dehalococcoidia bacterium]